MSLAYLSAALLVLRSGNQRILRINEGVGASRISSFALCLRISRDRRMHLSRREDASGLLPTGDGLILSQHIGRGSVVFTKDARVGDFASCLNIFHARLAAAEIGN